MEVLVGPILGKVVGELVDAVKAEGKKISFKSNMKSIESRLERIAPHLEEIASLDEQLENSTTAINELDDLVRDGKLLVDKCSKVHRGNFLKVRKYRKRLVKFEKNLKTYFSIVLPLLNHKVSKQILVNQQKNVSYSLLTHKPRKPLVKFHKKLKRYFSINKPLGYETSSSSGRIAAIFPSTQDEPEGSTSRERRDHQGNHLEIPMKKPVGEIMEEMEDVASSSRDDQGTLLEQSKNIKQILVNHQKNDSADGINKPLVGYETSSSSGRIAAIFPSTQDDVEGSTSRGRRDHQGNHLEIPIKKPVGYETSSSSGIAIFSSTVEENIVSICARDLTIEWIQNGRFWNWSSKLTQENLVYEVAELLQVWLLHVCGYFGTETLQQGIQYKVVFEVMLLDSASGWEVPVKLKLILPDGSVQQREERFGSKPRNQWLQITVGNFTMSPSTVGTIEFLLEDVTKKTAKKGILIKGAVITKALY